MKPYIILVFLCIVGVQCSDSRDKRNIDELLYKAQNLLSKPGYDYPKPGISQGPIWRDPEPVNSQGPIWRDPEPVNSQGPIWREPEPTYIETRPIYREPEQTWVQTRPVEPSYIVRPVYPQSNVVSRPVYRPQPGVTSEKLFWPFNKIATPLWGGGGSNSVGFPGSSNGNYYPSYPSIFQTKLAWLGNLIPGLGNTFGNGYPTSSMRTSYPVTKPVIYPAQTPVVYPAQNPVVYPAQNPVVYPAQTPAVYPAQTPAVYPAQTPAVYPVQIPAVYPVYESGVNSIGDSVVVEAGESDGYRYPKPTEQLPPLDLPNIQFRAEPKNDLNNRK